MLAIAVEFLTGRYVATSYNDRTKAEWPPHPARLFSALVAAHFDEPTDAGRAALEWLEQQEPPEIVAPGIWSERELHTVFVPVNDKASEPESRVRQPRTFPSVTPSVPHVQFVWPSAGLSTDTRCALDDLTARVVRLGHSTSLVSVHLISEAGETTWRPDQRGSTRLRVVEQGQLRALEGRFAMHRETEPRVMPASFRLYSDRPLDAIENLARSGFSENWLVFRRALRHERQAPQLIVPMTAAANLARTVRRALIRFAPQPPCEFLSGHQDSGPPSERPHLAVVPLPHVGGAFGDGTTVGVALVPPRSAAEQDLRAIYAAVGAWEASARGERDDERPCLPVHIGAAGVYEMRRVDSLDEDDFRGTLSAAAWIGPAHYWVTATPIALDRNPGELWSRDAARRERALAEARDVLVVACERVGLPRPAEIEILPAAALRGSAKTRHFPPFPGRADRHQRVLVHARLTFDERVMGPVLLGSGRYLGLGLLKPVDE
jgi:CRISPR-associated protein Csb2